MTGMDDGPNPDGTAHPSGLTGIDLVRRTLEEARAAARAQGKDAGRGRAVPPAPRRVAGQRRAGRGPDPTYVIRSRWAGWRAIWRRNGGGLRKWPRARCWVTGRRWSASQIADHATPTALNEGVLSVAAESTAWATQLRMIQAQLLAKIAAAVGNGVVTSLRITGPAAPSWRKGPRHIAGRGPRDTYG